MAEIEIKKNGFRCERCNHEWIPRLKEYPTICPVCKSAYWDKPRKNKTKKEVIKR